MNSFRHFGLGLLGRGSAHRKASRAHTHASRWIRIHESSSERSKTLRVLGLFGHQQDRLSLNRVASGNTHDVAIL